MIYTYVIFQGSSSRYSHTNISIHMYITSISTHMCVYIYIFMGIYLTVSHKQTGHVIVGTTYTVL